jgi:hypothetical protein
LLPSDVGIRCHAKQVVAGVSGSAKKSALADPCPWWTSAEFAVRLLGTGGRKKAAPGWARLGEKSVS